MSAKESDIIVALSFQGVVESKNNSPLYNPDSVSFMKLTHKNISENVKVNFQIDIILFNKLHIWSLNNYILD